MSAGGVLTTTSSPTQTQSTARDVACHSVVLSLRQFSIFRPVSFCLTDLQIDIGTLHGTK